MTRWDCLKTSFVYFILTFLPKSFRKEILDKTREKIIKELKDDGFYTQRR